MSVAVLEPAAGKALIEAQRRVPGGQWTLWLEQNIRTSQRQAQTYMRLAVYAPRLNTAMSISVALDVLAGLPRVGRRGKPSPPVELLQAARQLRAEAQPLSLIAERFGVSERTIERWVDPASRARQKAIDRRSYHRRRAAMALLREQEREREIKRAVRKAGGGISKLYADAERTQDGLAQAHREATNTEARVALSRAGEHHRQYRDQIVRALGVTR